jgi:sec-independent protein translocase protein TatC
MRKALRSFWRIITAPFRFIARLFRSLWRWIARTADDLHAFFTQEVDDAPVAEALNKALDDPTGILEHLDALRKHLLRGVLALAITTAFAFTFFTPILEWLSRPLEGGMESLVAIEVTEPIGTVMRVSLLTGFSLAFPYIAFELFLFIAPGLSRRARVAGLFAIPVATVFFIGGMAFAYFVMLPTALPFLLNFMGINTIPRPSSYIKFVTSLMFWIGIAFEFPLVIYLLAKLGWVNARMLIKQWRIAVVVIAVVAAMVTPTVDPVNMSLVMLPMVVLYAFSILLAFFARSKEPSPA